MQRFEYHVDYDALTAHDKPGQPSDEIAKALTERLNEFAANGWELVAVVPVTTGDGGQYRVAQITKAYYHYKRPIS